MFHITDILTHGPRIKKQDGAPIGPNRVHMSHKFNTQKFISVSLSTVIRTNTKEIAAIYVLEEEGDILFSSFCLTLLTPRSKCTQPCSGRRKNSPSNEQWTKPLHPGKCWCRNVGSSENRACSVSIHNAPWAFTLCVPFSTWSGLLFSSTEATTLEVCFQKSLLSCSREYSEKYLLIDDITPH